MNLDRLVKANTKLLDEKKVLERDIAILTKIINKAKEYAEQNELEILIKILNGDDVF